MKKADIYVILAGALWALTGITFQVLNAAGFTRMGAVVIRLCIACAGALVVCLVRRKSLVRIAARDLLYCAAAGVLGYAMFNFMYFNTIAQTSLSVAVAFLYTSPAFVILLSRIFYRQPVTKNKLLALAATLLGSVLATGTLGQTEQVSWLAVGFGLATGFGYALYNILCKAPLTRNPPEVVTFYTLLFGLVATCFMEPPTRLFPLLNSAAAIAAALGLGLVCCLLPFLLFSRGLAQSDPGRASILSSSELVVSTLIGFAQGDSISLTAIAGLLFLLAAVIFLNRGKR